MNNQNVKAPSSISLNPRTIVSGKLKRPTKQLTNVGSTSKKPFLKEYSLAMEQKLQTLKEKINEKKKQKVQQQTAAQVQKGSNSHIQKFLKPKSTKQQKSIQDQLIKQQFHEFLMKNNLALYKNLLIENQIDSLQILAEATQKQLEEIGIPKGHSLKLKVNINKWMQQMNRLQTAPKTKEILPRENRTKDSQRNRSFVDSEQSNNKNEVKNEELKQEMESICIGTQQDGIEQITLVQNRNKNVKQMVRSNFCLFCYQSIKIDKLIQTAEFCSQDCVERYNQMFKKYENNLLKAEQQFKKPQKTQQKRSEQQQENKDDQDHPKQEQSGFDFLDEKNQFYEDFDYENYEQIKRELGGY